jgi:hypothetical protein
MTVNWLLYKFERDLQIEIIDSLLRVRESEMIRSRDRSSRAKNRRWNVENVKNHIEMKMNVIFIAKEETFNNSILRQLSQFERVQMKTTMSDEIVNSKTVLAVHRADSVSSKERDRRRDKKRDKERDREQKRSSVRERRDREREQAVSKEI